MANQPTKYRKFVVGAASAALVASAVAPVAFAADFPDVKDNNSHKVAIDALSDAGVISGYPNGTFQPNKVLSRSDVVKMMGKWLISEGYKVPTDYKTNPRFTDLTSKSNEELLQMAALVKDNGVFNGNDGKLLPADNITRENMAVVLVRALDTLNDFDLAGYVAKKDWKKDVTDLDSAKSEARPAIDVLDYFDITNPAAPAFNPKNTTTRGQFASFLYKSTKVNFDEVNAYEVESVTATSATTLLVKLSNGKTHEVKLEKALVANVPTVVTFTIDGDDYTATVTWEVAAPKVETVEAINATEVQVTFTQVMDEDTVLNLDNYIFSKNGDKYEGFASLITDPEVDVDYNELTKTLTLRLNETFQNGDKYSVDIKDGVLQSADGKKVEKYTDTVKVFSDKVAPKLLATEIMEDKDAADKNVKKLRLTFDEPVKAETLTIDGQAVEIENVYPSVGAYTIVTEALPAKFLSVGNHAVKVYNVSDLLTVNENKVSIVSGSYTMTADTTAPTVKEIKQLDHDRKFEIVFTEEIDRATFDLANLVIKKGTHKFLQVATPGIVGKETTYTASIPAGNDRIIVTFSEDAISASELTVNPLYAKGENSAALSVEVSNYKDLVGLVGQKYTGTITVNKDLSAPVALANYKHDIKGNTLVVEFDKELKDLNASRITVKDKDGVSRTFKAVLVGGKVEIQITDQSGVAIANPASFAPYTVTFASGAVKKVSNGVVNAALTAVVKPQVAPVAPVADAVVDATVEKNVIKVVYDVPMATSAADLKNYTLDGEALPAGSTIKMSGENKVVEITLPGNVVPTTIEQMLTISKDVQTKAGATLVGDIPTKEAYTKMLKFTDNVQPKLTSAVVSAKDASGKVSSIELTFSETVTVNDSADFIDDFNLTVNGQEIAIATIAKAVDSKGAAIGNKAVITVADVNTFSQNQLIVVSTVAVGSHNAVVNVVDNAGNKMVTGTSVTVK